MAQISAGDLRSRVTVLRRVKTKNALGEDDYTYEPERKVWARIVPTTGRTESLEGDMERVEVTHRVTVRRAAIPELQTDLRLRYRDQDGGFLDLFVRLVIEDGVKSF